jgi:hypothetical protein
MWCESVILLILKLATNAVKWSASRHSHFALGIRVPRSQETGGWVSIRLSTAASLLSQSELHLLGHQLRNIICRPIQTALFRCLVLVF